MRYPNRRYGNPLEFRYYAESYPKKERLQILSKRLRRSERTIKNWLDEKERLPWWVPEILRLQRMEHVEMMRQMGFRRMETPLGVVKGTVLEFRSPRPEKTPEEPFRGKSPALNDGLVKGVDNASNKFRVLAD